MGERKGVNKYYPPDWDPSKGSINQYVGQHPLRDRAKKLGQGILVIRFEMPYNIWCGGCNAHIGMGVRYNAEKSKTGMYYTTPIYKFRMKCHLCDNYFEIQTDPKNHDYVILEGARRKEQRWDPTENGQIATEDKAVQKKMVTDAMFKLEHGSDDVQKGKKALSNLGSLEVRRDEWKDDYMLNKLARQKFRDEKKALKKEVDSDNALLEKSSLEIPLQKETEEDRKLAGLMRLRALESYDEKQTQKRKEIESRPLFESANKVAKVESKETKKLDIIKKHLNTARYNNSPFNSCKLNTIGSSISKKSLGIRKKVLPKLNGREKHDGNHTDTSKDISECFDPEDYNDLDNVSDTMKEQEENQKIEIDEKIVDKERLVCVVCRSKNINQGEKKNDMKNDDSAAPLNCNCHKMCNDFVNGTVNLDSDANSALGKPCATSDQVKSDNLCESNLSSSGTDDGKSDGQFSNGQSTAIKTGLGLVCAYSDTDSDA